MAFLKKIFTEILVKPVTLNGLKASYALIFMVQTICQQTPSLPHSLSQADTVYFEKVSDEGKIDPGSVTALINL